MKTIVLILCTMLFFSFTGFFNNTTVDGIGNIHYVGGNNPGNYTSIQDAIDNASKGDTIFVYQGVYSKPIDIYKKIDLRAEKGTVLDFNGRDDIISINADGCRIKGFVIRNCSGGVFFGIKLERETDNLVIENNVFKNNSESSLYLYYSSNIKILNNTFYDDGIFIVGKKSDWNSHTILNNTVNNLPILYYKNKINLNVSNLYCGQIILANCSKSIIKNNNVSGSKIGIFLGFSNNNSISKNNIKNNIFGIRLQYSNDNNIIKNNIEKNGYGIFIQHSQKNIIQQSNISFSNVDGCHLCCDSKNNIIYMNNFISNNKNAYDIFDNKWYKKELGNYWSDYSGFDKDGDFIGDVPYDISRGSSDLYPLINPVHNYLQNHIKESKGEDHIKIDNTYFPSALLLIVIIFLIFLTIFYFKEKK